MRKLKRLPLSSDTLSCLADYTKEVKSKLSKKEQKKEAGRLWNSKDKKAFDEIRKILNDMAPGLMRCMYCEDSAGTDIEHFWPKSNFPKKAFLWENYLLACSRCNSNEKRVQFPRKSYKPQLINPVEEEPRKHILFSPSTGKYSFKTTKGEKSILVYGLNRDFLCEGRKNAWYSLQANIIFYGAQRNKGNIKTADEYKRTICHYPFSGVLIDLINRIDKPGAKNIIEPECIQTIQKYPEIKNWIS